MADGCQSNQRSGLARARPPAKWWPVARVTHPHPPGPGPSVIRDDARAKWRRPPPSHPPAPWWSAPEESRGSGWKGMSQALAELFMKLSDPPFPISPCDPRAPSTRQLPETVRLLFNGGNGHSHRRR
ncbi:hypothetical protein chiPu_0024161 [Chiloscyllium punctatum]|uniref:Uncharacterized protein n=1 Tax=Chiloscyllium punctatum TaxID=137246 RepID=A0A401TBT9_CHIPU|nr:hypothetical protein [Chiloscyllium punctatum]